MSVADREAGEVVVALVHSVSPPISAQPDRGSQITTTAAPISGSSRPQVVVEEEEVRHPEPNYARYQVDADCAVTAGFDGDFEFGADTVGRNENRVAIACPLEVKYPPNRQFRHCAGAGRCADKRLYQLHHPVAGIDINTGFA
jgi:hypothetical protein